MWVFTKYGMFSAVCARKGDGKLHRKVDPQRIMVRARDRTHLEALQERFQELAALDIHESPHNDYRFRMFVAKDTWAVILGQLVLDVDYDNFKNAVGKWQGKQGESYKGALSNVWAVMYDLQRRKHGPGIYDRLKGEHEGDLFDAEDELFPEEEEDEEAFEDLAGMARHEPEPDDEVILVTDSEVEDGKVDILGVIWWPDNWTSPEEAYATAVQAGVLPLVAKPVCVRVSWSTMKDVNPTVFDFEAQDVPSSDDVVG